jgi:hypothetical protein
LFNPGSIQKGTLFAGKDVTALKRLARKFLHGEAARRIVGNDGGPE